MATVPALESIILSHEYCKDADFPFAASLLPLERQDVKTDSVMCPSNDWLLDKYPPPLAIIGQVVSRLPVSTVALHEAETAAPDKTGEAFTEPCTGMDMCL